MTERLRIESELAGNHGIVSEAGASEQRRYKPRHRTVSSTTMMSESLTLAPPPEVRPPVTGSDYVGSDYAGKSQVLNVILSQQSGIDGNITAVFLKVYADATLIANQDQKPSHGEYAFRVKLKPGLITYKVEFGTRGGGREAVRHTVRNIVCGDAYVIDGQSNALAVDWGPGEHPDTSPWVRSFGSNDGDVAQGWGFALQGKSTP